MRAKISIVHVVEIPIQESSFALIVFLVLGTECRTVLPGVIYDQVYIVQVSSDSAIYIVVVEGIASHISGQGLSRNIVPRRHRTSPRVCGLTALVV